MVFLSTALFRARADVLQVSALAAALARAVPALLRSRPIQHDKVNRDDERFKVRPRPPRSRPAPRSETFLKQVQLAVNRSGGHLNLNGCRRRQAGSRIGRGFVATRLNAGSPNPRSRRVVIKTRIVYLQRVGDDAVAAHLRYIARDGIARDSESSQLPYDSTTDRVDLDEFRARGANNRHEFRFIIAPEDAVELGDLRGFTRNLMERAGGRSGDHAGLGSGRPLGYGQSTHAHYARITRAVIDGDRDVVAREATPIGYAAADDSPERIQAVVDVISLVCEPLRHLGRYDFSKSDLPSRVRAFGLDLAFRRGFLRSPPPETIFLHRKLVGSNPAGRAIFQRLSTAKPDAWPARATFARPFIHSLGSRIVAFLVHQPFATRRIVIVPTRSSTRFARLTRRPTSALA